MAKLQPIEPETVQHLTSIKVFSPATIANVGCGYDILGFALEDLGEIMKVTMEGEPGLRIRSISGGYDLPVDPEKNLATIAAKALLESYGEETGGFSFELDKNIHPGSGLGTSASSSSAAVFAVNHLLGNPFSETELIEFAMQGEKAISGKVHADNVAPAIMGGFVGVRGYDPVDVFRLKYPEDLYVSIIHPQIQVKTMDAKRMLRSSLELSQAITQWGNVAGLVTGLAAGDLDLVKRSMKDEVAEPVRSMLIPYYDLVKQRALEAGAAGCNIAGSGPSIFAFSDSEKNAHVIRDAMLSPYRKGPVTAHSFISKIGKEGVRVV